MKFTVETTQLKEALKRLGFAVNGKSIMPALTNILVTVTKGEILLTSTDLMTTISYRIECSTDGEGQFLMPFEQSKNIIALEQGDVQVVCTKGHVSMKFEADNFSLGNGGDVADFPKIPTVPKKGMVDFDKSLVQALSMAALSVSKEESRETMQSICIELQQDKAFVTATDASCLYHEQVSITGNTNTELVELLVPTVVAKVAEGFDTGKLGFSKNQIGFECGPLFITCKRSEGKFPAYRNVLPPHAPVLTLNLNHLKDAVAKAYIMSDATYNGIDFYPAEKELTIKTLQADTNMGCTLKMPAEYKHTLEQIRFNGRLMKRAIAQLEAHVEEETEITVCITTAAKAATFQPKGNENLTVLLMPINISN